jgi:hypothetical protein
MGKRTRNSLILATSLVLVLPPGWCRFVCLPIIRSAKAESPQSHGGCCDLCHRQDREEPAPEPPKPPPPSRCCCYELDWLKPTPPKKIEADLSLAAYLTPMHDLPPRAVRPDGLGLSLPGPSPPLHILKCVWLC